MEFPLQTPGNLDLSLCPAARPDMHGLTPVPVASTLTVLVLEPSVKMAYFSVSNKVLAAEPFPVASGHYTKEGDREGLSVKLEASQSLSRAAVLSAQV